MLFGWPSAPFWTGLVSGLGDLNRGKRPELLKPAPREKAGNPGLPQGRAFRLGTACAAIDILSDNRADTVENVETEVARAIGMEIGALKSWRKAFNAGSKDPQAHIAYERVLQIAASGMILTRQCAGCYGRCACTEPSQSSPNTF
jgi:hypothetical protein